jgi:hypothetical protein
MGCNSEHRSTSLSPQQPTSWLASHGRFSQAATTNVLLPTSCQPKQRPANNYRSLQGLQRIAKTNEQFPTACSKPPPANGHPWPSRLSGRARSATHHGQKNRSPYKGRIHLRRPADRHFAFPLQSDGGPYIAGKGDAEDRPTGGWRKITYLVVWLPHGSTRCTMQAKPFLRKQRFEVDTARSMSEPCARVKFHDS